jgi:hypothetical protein
MNGYFSSKGPWRCYIGDLVDYEDFPTSEWMTAKTEPASPITTGMRTQRSAVVEVFRDLSGITPRALMGGSFEAGGAETLIRVASMGEIPYGQVADFPSSLSRQPFVRGLSSEFASYGLRGLVEEFVASPMPPGVVSVTAGGYDELNSGSLAFRAAAALLRVVLDPSRQWPVRAEDLDEVMTRWTFSGGV